MPVRSSYTCKAVLGAFSVLALAVSMGPAALSAHAQQNNAALIDMLRTSYKLSEVGTVVLHFDYTRVTKQGTTLIVRIPGIYADMAGMSQTQRTLDTDITDGVAKVHTGFQTYLNNTNKSRTFNVGEPVDILGIKVKHDAIHFQLLSANLAVIGNGDSTRYLAEVNIKIPNMDSMKPEDVKKIIDVSLAEASIANATQSKTIKIGMGPDEVKQSLGNPDKIVDLGAKQIYIYKDMKVVFVDSKVSDVE